MAIFRSLYHSLVFSRVFIGLEQNLVQLLLNGGWAGTCYQLLGPVVNLCLNTGFFLNRRQRLLHDFGRGFFEAPFRAARTTEIMGGLEQCQQRGRLFYGRRRVLEIVFGNVAKTEFFFWREFPQQLHINVLAGRRSRGQEFGRTRLVKLQHDVAAFGFHALARI